MVGSHDLPWSFTASEIVCMMKGGQLRASGEPGTLAGKPDLLWDAVGAALIPSENPNALYRYALAEMSAVR